jgi:hypothetical protein
MNSIKKKDRMAKQVEKTLMEHYIPTLPGAKCDVYRVFGSSIWIRVVHPSFAGKEIPERDEAIWAVIRKHVPKEIISHMTVVLLIAPEEMETDGMNYEFEHPSPSRL